LAKNNVRQTVEMDEAPGSVKSGNWWETSGCSICDATGRSLSMTGLSGLAIQEKALREFAAHMKMCKYLNPKKIRHGNGVPNGAFAFTLTKSPKDALTISDMLVGVRKIMRQKSCPVIKYAWYYEDKGRDENGDAIHPHIHGMYETATGGRIERKHFKRAWPIWDENTPIGAGFRGGYHRPVKSDEKYNNYISKDGGMGETFGLTDEQPE